MLTDKRVVVTGGTGSLGQALVRRLLEGDAGLPAEVVVFSRSEALQHEMRLGFLHRRVATDEIVYDEERHSRLRFRIGDVRDYEAVAAVLEGADVVLHAAAMKQVPTCEYHPAEAVNTNVGGARNIVRAIADRRLEVEAVVGVSTDKACKPVNVMGMTKALQERILLEAGLRSPGTRFVVARYGNVVASRGSVVPLFEEQIASGGPVTVTTPEMTRFLLSLDQAVDTVFEAHRTGRQGETYIPLLPAVRIEELARAMIGDRDDRALLRRHSPRREGARGARLRGGGAADALAAARIWRSRRCSPSSAPTPSPAPSRTPGASTARPTRSSPRSGSSSCCDRDEGRDRPRDAARDHPAEQGDRAPRRRLRSRPRPHRAELRPGAQRRLLRRAGRPRPRPPAGDRGRELRRPGRGDPRCGADGVRARATGPAAGPRRHGQRDVGLRRQAHGDRGAAHGGRQPVLRRPRPGGGQPADHRPGQRRAAPVHRAQPREPAPRGLSPEPRADDRQPDQGGPGLARRDGSTSSAALDGLGRAARRVPAC